MSKTKKLLINADHPEECRAVVLENGKLEEIIVEHSSHELVKGNVYFGVITRVEPAIEAAFVDIGSKKYGFLPFKDVLPESYLQTGEKKSKTRIQDVMVRGQNILVQVVKESRDTKGPSLTNMVTIPGRFLVLMCSGETSGISRKIEDESERKKLKELVADLDLPSDMGVIIRTAGLGRTKAELQKDLTMLLKIWEGIQTCLDNPDSKAPVMLYEGPDMVLRTVRDHFTADTSEIIVDNIESFKALNEFMKMLMPRMRNRVKFYEEAKPLFSYYKVEEQIESIYHRHVSLPSGGSIVIDTGEAMVSIDVNSGKTTGASQLEETALKTNLEAADEITRQLRLRDLGGLIVIDFIDMFHKKNQSLVEKQVKLGCKNDKARVNISRISRFGLLEMSRQRLSPPVREGAFEACSHCSATGYVKTVSHMALYVLRKIQEHVSVGNVKVLGVKISSPVADYLLSHKLKFLSDFEEKHGFTIKFSNEENLAQDDFAFTILDKKKQEDITPESVGEAAGQKAEPRRRERNDQRGRGRGRRTSTQRSRPPRRATLTASDTQEEEFTSEAGEAKEAITSETKVEGVAMEAPKEEANGNRSRERRPSSYRKRDPRRSASRRRPRRSPRPAGETAPDAAKSDSGGTGGAASEPEASLSDGNKLSPPPATVVDKKMDPPVKQDPEKEVEDRQPQENVSRLHETVTQAPRPVFRGYPNDDENLEKDDR